MAKTDTKLKAVESIKGDLGLLQRMLSAVQFAVEAAEGWERLQREADTAAINTASIKAEAETLKADVAKAKRVIAEAKDKAASIIAEAQANAEQMVAEGKLAANAALDAAKDELAKIKAKTKAAEGSLAEVLAACAKEAETLAAIREESAKVKTSLEGLLSKVG